MYKKENIEKKCQNWHFFYEEKQQKMLKKMYVCDINIQRKTIEKMNLKMEEKNVKK